MDSSSPSDLNSLAPAIRLAEPVPLDLPVVRCHAVTLAEIPGGLLLAFFGGAYSGTQDQGIWVLVRDGRRNVWGEPHLAARPREPGAICWNPVLHAQPDGALLLFYKEGPSVAAWWGMLTRSDDGGRTWGEPRRLPEGIWGPIRNKPVPHADGGLICGSSTEHDDWCVHFERTFDEGASWERTDRLEAAGGYGVIQPTILPWPSGRWQALCRSDGGFVVETFTEDGGRTWTPLRQTALPNPNSALDGVILPDGRGLIVYNPMTLGRHIHDHRTKLALALSPDGSTWRPSFLLEDGPAGWEYSYPAVLLTHDGLVHVAYTAGRGWTGLKHVVLDPDALPDRT